MPVQQIKPNNKLKATALAYYDKRNNLPKENIDYLNQKGPLTRAAMIYEIGPKNLEATNKPHTKLFYGLDSIDEKGHFESGRLKKENYLNNLSSYKGSFGFKPAVDIANAIMIKSLDQLIPNNLKLKRKDAHPADYRWINQAYYTFGPGAFSDTINGYHKLKNEAKVKELQRAITDKYDGKGKYGTLKVNGLYVRQALADLFNK